MCSWVTVRHKKKQCSWVGEQGLTHNTQRITTQNIEICKHGRLRGNVLFLQFLQLAQSITDLAHTQISRQTSKNAT